VSPQEPHAPSSQQRVVLCVDWMTASGFPRTPGTGHYTCAPVLVGSLRGESVVGVEPRIALWSYSFPGSQVGIDTVPIPGDTDPAKIRAVLQDVAALAFKYDKQLSCRCVRMRGSWDPC
jgi:hypothetical protein